MSMRLGFVTVLVFSSMAFSDIRSGYRHEVTCEMSGGWFGMNRTVDILTGGILAPHWAAFYTTVLAIFHIGTSPIEVDRVRTLELVSAPDPQSGHLISTFYGKAESGTPVAIQIDESEKSKIRNTHPGDMLYGSARYALNCNIFRK